MAFPDPSPAAAGHATASESISSPVVYINRHPAYGTAPGCGQLLRGPGLQYLETRRGAGGTSHDDLAPFLTDDLLQGSRCALLEEPAVLAVESALLLWSSAVHGPAAASASGPSTAVWCPPRATMAAWRQTLCAALVAPRLAGQKKHTRRLLLVLCGGHSGYRDTRSGFLLEHKLERLRVLSAVHAHAPGDYAAKCELLNSLTSMLEVNPPPPPPPPLSGQPAACYGFGNGRVTERREEGTTPG